MFNSILKTSALFSIALTFIQCSNDPKKSGSVSIGDSITVVETNGEQQFEFSSDKNQVLEGKQGTLIVCPKGCFLDADGKVVEGDVTVFLKEALSLEDMLLSNLSTTSNGAPLETDGMIHLTASSDDEPLTINPKIPIHIEIPTKAKKQGMKVYKGVEDAKGSINWVNPKPIDTYLKTFELSSLDFLPQGFFEAVSAEIPFNGHQIATKELAESTYYQMANLKLIEDEIDVNMIKEPMYDTMIDNNVSDYISPHGINPSSIKALKSPEFQNTLIATKEFELRLQLIFQSCTPSLLDIYLDNLHKNLYEIDYLAAKASSFCPELEKQFTAFGDLHQTKVSGKTINTSLLKQHYLNRVKAIQSEIEKQQAQIQEARKKDNAKLEKALTEYKDLLQKRETIRMESYGFDWTDVGWVNIDKGIEEKEWESKPIESLIAENGAEYDRVHTYLVFISRPTIYRLVSDNNQSFDISDVAGSTLPMPKSGTAALISIGYKGDSPSMYLKEIDLKKPIKYRFKLGKSTPQAIKKALKPYSSKDEANDVETDLKHLQEIYTLSKASKARKSERERLIRFQTAALYPCSLFYSEEL